MTDPATMGGRRFLIEPEPGFTREVGRLVAMLNYARATTLEAVQGLSIERLDHRHDATSNSIGCLLAHVAAVEHAYRIETFEQRALTAEERSRWEAALRLGPQAWSSIRGRPLDSFLSDLGDARRLTLDSFRSVDDEWLDRREPIEEGLPVNRYWQWFHVCEDELSHRGQIRWLRTRLPH